MRAAFEAAITDLRSGIDWSALLAALGRQDVAGALAAMHIDQAAFYQYSTVKTSSFAEAGAAAMTTISVPGAGTIGIRFGMSNPGAESWISREVGNKITGQIIPEQIALVRQSILTGFARGDGPVNIARDIAGRVVGGVRQGGVLGLDAERAKRLAAVTDGIKTPEGIRGLVTVHRDGSVSVNYKVNKQTEARILQAYRNGTAISARDQEISMRQYSNRLLKDRADTVARAETAQAVSSARREAWEQVMAGRNIPAEAILKRWVHGGGPKDPRPHHVAMSGHIVRGIDSSFEFSNGARLQFAHDPSGPASETILCGCNTEYFVDPAWGLS
jgi:hypothetical protein